MKRLVLLLALVAFVGCSATSGMLPMQKAFVEEAMLHPLNFYVPHDDVENAWGRAQSWLGRYSDMKLQTVTDYVIQTYNPPRNDKGVGYSVTKTPVDGGARFQVSANCGWVLGGEKASANAHILAQYIATAKEPIPGTVK